MDSKESQGDKNDAASSTGADGPTRMVDEAVLKELERMYKLIPNEPPCDHPHAVTYWEGLYTLHCKHCGRYAIADETAARRLGWIE
jgi:hypothetical protein